MLVTKGGRTVLTWASVLLFAGTTAVYGEPPTAIQVKVDTHLSASGTTTLKDCNKEVPVDLKGRRVVLHMYLPDAAPETAPMVFYSSGSGGWHRFDQHIATVFAERGMPFFGISTHTYLKTFYSDNRPATFPEVASDYAELIRQARTLTSVGDSRPIILAGWSLGAGYAPLIAADPRIRTNLSGIISISLSRNNETALTLSHRLMSRLTGRTFGPSFDVFDYLSRLAPLPVAIIQAANDRTASPRQAEQLISSMGREGRLRLFEVAGGRTHSFSGGREEFDRTLEKAVDWIRGNAPEPLTGECSPTHKQSLAVLNKQS